MQMMPETDQNYMHMDPNQDNPRYTPNPNSNLAMYSNYQDEDHQHQPDQMYNNDQADDDSDFMKKYQEQRAKQNKLGLEGDGSKKTDMDENVKNFFDPSASQPFQTPQSQMVGPSVQDNYNLISIDNGVTPILKKSNSRNNQESQLNQYDSNIHVLPRFTDNEINLYGNESRLNYNN